MPQKNVTPHYWIAILTTSILYLLLLNNTAQAQEKLNFPVPTGNPDQLFYLQRSSNTNTIVYELNIKNGAIDTFTPIHIFWICYAEHGQKEELTFLQRKYAYGVKIKQLSYEHYELRFLANKKSVMELMKGADNQFHIYEQINGQRAILTRMFLQIDGGGFFSPNITSVSVWGLDPKSNTRIFEKRKVM